MKDGDIIPDNTRTGKGNEPSLCGLIMEKCGIYNFWPVFALLIDKIVLNYDMIKLNLLVFYLSTYCVP